MDAYVNLKDLENERDLLEKEIKRLKDLAELVEAESPKNKSDELEGHQFEIASEVIDSLVSKVEESILHMSVLKANLEELIEEVSQYVKCEYGEM